MNSMKILAKLNKIFGTMTVGYFLKGFFSYEDLKEIYDEDPRTELFKLYTEFDKLERQLLTVYAINGIEID